MSFFPQFYLYLRTLFYLQVQSSIEILSNTGLD